MNRKEFVDSFQTWRANNNYPNREDCRECFRKYRDFKKSGNTYQPIECFEYILSQDKPAMFLDSLFSKNGAIKQLDRVRLEAEKPKRDFKAEIIECVYEYAKTNHFVPNFSVINNLLDFKANKYYDTEKDIADDIKKQHPDIANYVLSEADFTSEYRKKTADAIKSHKKFFITTAVSGKKVCAKLFESVKNYLKYNNAICLVLPCEDMLNRKSVYNWQLPSILREDNFYVVYNDTYLNSNLYISDIKISAKQINPQSGLPQFTQDGSVIIASPKQDLDYVANSNNQIPTAIMTTGAITENDYSNDAFMSQRLNKIAEYEHVLGGIIVEIQDDKIFHFRQVQMGANGEIIDLGMVYSGDNKPYPTKNPVMVVGDSHFGEHDEVAIEAEEDMIDFIGIKNLVLHDVFSGISITHHDKNKTITLAKKAIDGKISLEDEANIVAQHLDRFADKVDGEVIIVDSNHHEHLDRYLEEGRYATDKINLRYSLDIVKAMLDGEQLPVRYMIENQTYFRNKNKVKWLEPDEDFNYYGIEVSQHGARGANGSKGNLAIFRKAYKKSMSAHTHQPRIYRGAVSVGTSSLLRLSYNKGLSSWVQGVGIIYENGTFQLINIVQDKNGNYNWKLNEDK